VISLLNEKATPVVFILWGSHAKAKRSLITNPRHLILEGTHPSGLSAHRGGFFGGKYFSKTNLFLIKSWQDPIVWRIE
jgi:uracil-DNA glycosylase